MAVNPVVYDCPAGAWTLIASAVNEGLITILEPLASYRLTYRLSNTVPATQEEVDESPKVQSLQIDIKSPDSPIYVFIWCVAGKDGKVTVYT